MLIKKAFPTFAPIKQHIELEQLWAKYIRKRQPSKSTSKPIACLQPESTICRLIGRQKRTLVR